ncbi:MAG: family 16 glycosylhydrolase [Anaerolineae bacterium]|nr:family 16 glycosylhydrolase [Anaerolineae bacterium]
MTTGLHDDFSRGVGDHWQRMELSSGHVDWTGASVRLVNDNTSAGRYSNAQIDDCQGRPRKELLWSPPLHLTVRARFSHPAPPLRAGGDCDYEYLGGPILSGTAGFGFWNAPSTLEGHVPALPRALWFFYASPPSNIKLASATPGCGWKAATFDASGWPFRLLALTAPVAVPLMNWQAAYRRLWPIGQRAIGVSEAPVAADMTEWHTYVIQWEEKRARFLVDGDVVLDCDTVPRGPLGLVIWLDNQSLVLTPQGRLRHRLLHQPEKQWLEMAEIEIA